jgi:hypothetical protein
MDSENNDWEECRCMQRRSFSNTRTRFQRLRDAKLFAGWVRNFARNTLIVTINKQVAMEPGEEFSFQVFGHGSSAVFRAALVVQCGDELTFAITDAVRLVKTHEEIRLLVEGVTGVLRYDGCETEVHMVDISPGGAGLLIPHMIQKDTKVDLTIDSPQGQILCEGIVRYCRAEDRVPGQYRVGMTLKPHNRVDVARWQRLLMADAA